MSASECDRCGLLLATLTATGECGLPHRKVVECPRWHCNNGHVVDDAHAGDRCPHDGLPLQRSLGTLTGVPPL